jgi:hypothetical protein
MLLNAYGWWKVSQITYIIALICYALGGLALIGSAAGLATGRRNRTQPDTRTHTGKTPVMVA